MCYIPRSSTPFIFFHYSAPKLCLLFLYTRTNPLSSNHLELNTLNNYFLFRVYGFCGRQTDVLIQLHQSGLKRIKLLGLTSLAPVSCALPCTARLDT
jgi:hypothetical protein